MVAVLAVASIGIATLAGCGGGGSGQGGHPTWTFGLGDLSAEQTYYDTHGAGTVTVNSDPSAPEPAVALLECGQKSISINHTLLGVYAPELQIFIEVHEFGHQYRGDPARLSGIPNLVEEWIADAYATRVMYSDFGAATVQDCIVDMAALNLPGDEFHPSSSQRASYMQTVLGAVIANEHSVPTPPSVSNLLPSTGTLIVSDTTGAVIDVLVDSIPVGGPIACGFIVLEMSPAGHRVDLYDDITGYHYWSGIAVIANGETTFAPF